jgi:MoxR-like ATPase
MIELVARRLRENIQKVIVGKDEVINLTLVAVLCEGHVLIEDVPGIGKTTLARALAASLGCSFRRIQFTPICCLGCDRVELVQPESRSSVSP